MRTGLEPPTGCPRTMRRMRSTAVAVAASTALAVVVSAAGADTWRRGAALPLPRTEVASARIGSTEIAVVGGFTANGSNSARADAYSPARNRWRRLPNLPVAVDHAVAASARGQLYVFGGYGADRDPLSRVFVFSGRRWRALPSMPEPRAAAGAAIARGKIYVVGGVTRGGLARTALTFDLRRRRWSRVAGPTPREHLAATASGGRVYALAGRTAGFDTNLGTFEVYDAARRRWRRLPPVPEPRGGTGAAASGRTIVSVGGEASTGTIGKVYAFDVRTRRWRRLPDLPTPRHGLGVVAFGGRIYALAGGPRPGLHVTGANEYIGLKSP